MLICGEHCIWVTPVPLDNGSEANTKIRVHQWASSYKRKQEGCCDQKVGSSPEPDSLHPKLCLAVMLGCAILSMWLCLPYSLRCWYEPTEVHHLHRQRDNWEKLTISCTACRCEDTATSHTSDIKFYIHMYMKLRCTFSKNMPPSSAIDGVWDSGA